MVAFEVILTVSLGTNREFFVCMCGATKKEGCLNQFSRQSV
jgi:hypothetical protein